MSMEEERIVRGFLQQKLPQWQTLPYDWLDFDIEDLDTMGLANIPQDVIDAYRATRNNPHDRARDEMDYGKVITKEEKTRALLQRRVDLGLPLIPIYDHVDKLTAAQRAEYVRHEEYLLDFIEKEVEAGRIRADYTPGRQCASRS